jgi:ABC-type branched-chain amino acid transport system, permease component
MTTIVAGRPLQRLLAAGRGGTLSERTPAHLVTLGLVTVALLVAPHLNVNSYHLTVLYYVLFYAAFTQTWNLSSGMTGYLSFAHPFLLAAGGYAALFGLHRGLGLSAAIALGAGIGLLAGGVLALTSVRARHLVFGFLTLFIVMAMEIVAELWTPVTGGVSGLIAPKFTSFELSYYLTAVALLVTTLAIVLLRSRIVGREVLAIRDDEDVAASVGINTSMLKALLFGAAGGLTGLIGASHVLFLGSAHPNNLFPLHLIVLPLALTLVGGASRVWGPLLAAGGYTLLTEMLRVSAPTIHLIILGAAVVLVARLRSI